MHAVQTNLKNVLSQEYVLGIIYNFKEIWNSQIMWIQAVFYIKWCEKCYILKMWHAIEATKKKIIPKGVFFTFEETILY
jgi:hypothetical protein